MSFKIFILLTMIFLHMVADYNLQGWLAQSKQISYWTKNCPGEKYQNDYLACLLCHSFSWAFMVMLPVLLLHIDNIGLGVILMFIGNMGLHFFIDNEKANNFTLNLIQDQLLHLAQIVSTWIVLVYIL